MENWSETKKIVLTAVILVVSTIFVIILSGHTESVFAATDNVTVIVNISTLSQIEVLPEVLEWVLCTPGADCGNKTIDVKNTGSVNVTNTYASVNTTNAESTNPLPLGTASSYSSGGLMAMANDTNLTWLFVGRLEWNLSAPPAGYDTRIISGVTNKSWGWFRNVSDNYLWELINGTGSEEHVNCSGPGTILTIEADADDGTVSTRAPSINGTISTTDGKNWAVFTFATGPWDHYCVATYYDCTRIFLYKYDYGNLFPTCGSRKYLTSNLVPGDSKTWNVRAWVPEGIPAGNLTVAALTITAT